MSATGVGNWCGPSTVASMEKNLWLIPGVNFDSNFFSFIFSLAFLNVWLTYQILFFVIRERKTIYVYLVYMLRMIQTYRAWQHLWMNQIYDIYYLQEQAVCSGGKSWVLELDIYSEGCWWGSVSPNRSWLERFWLWGLCSLTHALPQLLIIDYIIKDQPNKESLKGKLIVSCGD